MICPPQRTDEGVAGMDAIRDMTAPTGAASTGPAGELIELTVVVPTFNERQNVPLMVERLETVLAGVRWEVVFVDDDSPDDTAGVARELAARDRRVRVIRRLGRRGLSSACVEGVMSSAAPYFAVMDGDLQHDDTVLPEMLRRLKAGRLDLVVASRYASGGSASGLAGRGRHLLSEFGGRIAQVVLSARLSDPMSGFFVMARAAFDQLVHRLSQQGFKILLDIFASAPRPLSFAEVPCRFNARRHGESKLDTMAAWEFLILIVDKLIGRVLPVRFVIFAGVGATGIIVHLVWLALMAALGLVFATAQATAIIAAMTWNFILNNTVTYRDQRLRGPAFFRGLASFYAIGAVGALANVGISQMVFVLERRWWLAGVAGALIGVVWNFTMSNLFTWRQRSLY